MKKIVTILLAVFLVLTATAQTKKPISKDIIITPGVGIGKLVLGMSTTDAVKLLGGEISWFDYKEEMKGWTASENMRIDSIPQFIIGFDSCMKYAKDIPDNYPIYSLYFKQGKLVFINITSYGAKAEILKKVKLKNGLKFKDAETKCLTKLGKNFMKISYGSYDDHVYYTMGMEVSYDENKLVTIAIFKPSNTYPQQLADNSKRLLQEFEAFKSEE